MKLRKTQHDLPQTRAGPGFGISVLNLGVKQEREHCGAFLLS